MIGLVLLAIVLGLGTGLYLLFSRPRGPATKALILVLLGAVAWAAARTGLELGGQVMVFQRAIPVQYGPWRTVHEAIPVSWEGVDTLDLELVAASVELRPGPGAVLATIEAPESLLRRLEVVARRQDGSLLLENVPPPADSPARYQLTIQLPMELPYLEVSPPESTRKSVHWFGMNIQGVSVGEAVIREAGLEVRDAVIGDLSLRDPIEVRLVNAEIGHLTSSGGVFRFRVLDPRVPPEGAVYEIEGCDYCRYLFAFTGPFHLRLALGPGARLETDLTPRREGESHIFGDEALPSLQVQVGEGTVEVLALLNGISEP